MFADHRGFSGAFILKWGDSVSDKSDPLGKRKMEMRLSFDFEVGFFSDRDLVELI